MNPDMVKKERRRHVRMRDRMYQSKSLKTKKLWKFLRKRFPDVHLVNQSYSEYNSNFSFCCSPRISWTEFTAFVCKNAKIVCDVGGHYLMSFEHLQVEDGKFTEEQKKVRQALTKLWGCNKMYTTYVVLTKEVYNNVQNGASSK